MKYYAIKIGLLRSTTYIVHHAFDTDFDLPSQELSPTNDTNLVKSLMNLIDSLTDEFQDEAMAAQQEDRELTSWLEVRYHFYLACF